MSNHRIRPAALLLACMALGLAGNAQGHELKGSLRARSTATDTLYIQCSEGDASTQLYAQISDLKPKFLPRLRLTLTKDGQSLTAIDSIDGDGKFSPQVSVQAGDGTYTVTIGKLPRTDTAPDRTRAFAELYLLDFHCYTSGNHTETSIRYAPGGNQ